MGELVKRYQMVCPHCKHEFTYDNGYYDANIERLSADIHAINCALAKHNQLPWPEKKARTEWWRRQKRLLAEKQKELGELKAIRKVADQRISHMEFRAFKNAVREEFGDEIYRRLLDRANKELEAYSVSSLMQMDYSRPNYKSSATSVSKL